MKKLIAIGEALIDFIPEESGKPIRQVSAFAPKVGGAPANVCGVFSKMGAQSQLITQLGNDPFGDKIVEEFKDFGIGCEYIKRTDKANTSLAFVALQEDGNREFSFYRKPGADMLLEADDVKEQWFADADILHFCSVSLGEFPMKYAHKRAIEYARENGMIISFDPNLRPPLWDNAQSMCNTVREFIPLCDILKVSDEEIEQIAGSSHIEEALPKLFAGNVKMVIYTKGGDGAELYTKAAKAQAPSYSEKVVDTTGAGDSFIGSFLYQLSRDGVKTEDLEKLDGDTLKKYLEFSSHFSAISVGRKGAIASYPDAEEMEQYL